jgi:hypothetical protein
MIKNMVDKQEKAQEETTTSPDLLPMISPAGEC